MKRFRLRNFLLLTVAGIINSIGVTLFLAPVRLYDSGISGTSMFLSQLTPEWLSLSVFLLLLNIPLFLFGWKKQGFVFTVYAIYSVLIYSVSAYLIEYVLPIDVSLTSPLAGNDLLLCALFGGVLSGIGSGLAIRFGGAMDGMEVLAVIFAKRIGITVGTFMMAYNAVLYLICALVLSSWELPLYSIIAYAVALKSVDYLVEGFDRSKAAFIVTERPEQVCKALSGEFGTGLTLLNAKGYYSHSDKTVVYMIVNRFQIVRLKTILAETDPNSFVTISDVADVLSKKTFQPKS